jgi:ParB-like chromosome segregation protein Spo0J
MKLSLLKLNPSNPRFIRDAKFCKLINSIKEFPKMMELRPIIIDDEGMILGGNMRYRAVKELGYKDIPDAWVKKASELTEDEKKRFIIADNIQHGEWDFDILANEFEIEDLENWGLELQDKIDSKIQEVNLKPFKQTHILISFAPELIIKISKELERIKATEGIEFIQSSN